MDNYLFIPRALAAALYDASFATAFGMVLAELWIGRDAEPALRARLRRSSIFCAFTMLLALCAQAYLATATMIASAAVAQVRSQISTVLTSTHEGQNIFTTGKMTLCLLLAFGSSKRPLARPWVLLGMLALFAAVRSSSGHAAAHGSFSIAEYVQFVHLTSIAVWAGGVIAGGLLVLPALSRSQLPNAMFAFTRRLSTTVTFALALVILSGIYNAYQGLGGSLAPLRNTQWGWLLDAKSLLVLVAVALGALNRRLLHTSPPPANRLAALLRAEAIVMVLILIVSAFLANSPPADMAM